MSTLVNRNRRCNSIRERIAVHEAGHVIAGVVFGIPITRATIVEDPLVQCGRYHTDLANLVLEANVTFYLAGTNFRALPLKSGAPAYSIDCRRSQKNPFGPVADMQREALTLPDARQIIES
jgi:hypothetical protein